MGKQGVADLCFHSPQPDTSLYCETTGTGLVHRVVCLFTPFHPPPLPAFTEVLIYTAWWQRHMGVNNLPKVVTRQCVARVELTTNYKVSV